MCKLICKWCGLLVVMIMVLGWCGCAGWGHRKNTNIVKPKDSHAKKVSAMLNDGRGRRVNQGDAVIKKIGPDRPQRIVYFNDSPVKHYTLYMNRSCDNKQGEMRADSERQQLHTWRQDDAICLLTGPLYFIGDIVAMPVSMIRDAPWHYQESKGFGKPIDINEQEGKGKGR